MSNWAEWIGRTSTREQLLDPTQVQKMQVTLGNDVTLDSGDTLPPAWHWLYFSEQTKSQNLGADGHTQLGLTLPAFSLPRRMWAGGKINWLNHLIIGEVAQRTSKILHIEEKSGRSGDLIFLTMQHEVSQNQTLCIREEQNIVYRGAVNSTQPVTTKPAPTDFDFEKSWTLDEVTLFRYSALTFNSHRIHYDADYTRDVEGYPGLIVHGPLLATLLLDLAVSNNRPVNEFTYRAMSPITLPMRFSTQGNSNKNETHLWVASESGALAMQAELI